MSFSSTDEHEQLQVKRYEDGKDVDDDKDENGHEDGADVDVTDLRSGNSGKPGYTEQLQVVKRPFLAAPVISRAILRLRPRQKTRRHLRKNLTR